MYETIIDLADGKRLVILSELPIDEGDKEIISQMSTYDIEKLMEDPRLNKVDLELEE